MSQDLATATLDVGSQPSPPHSNNGMSGDQTNNNNNNKFGHQTVANPANTIEEETKMNNPLSWSDSTAHSTDADADAILSRHLQGAKAAMDTLKCNINTKNHLHDTRMAVGAVLDRCAQTILNINTDSNTPSLNNKAQEQQQSQPQSQQRTTSGIIQENSGKDPAMRGMNNMPLSPSSGRTRLSTSNDRTVVTVRNLSLRSENESKFESCQSIIHGKLTRRDPLLAAQHYQQLQPNNNMNSFSTAAQQQHQQLTIPKVNDNKNAMSLTLTQQQQQQQQQQGHHDNTHGISVTPTQQQPEQHVLLKNQRGGRQHTPPTSTYQDLAGETSSSSTNANVKPCKKARWNSAPNARPSVSDPSENTSLFSLSTPLSTTSSASLSGSKSFNGLIGSDANEAIDGGSSPSRSNNPCTAQPMMSGVTSEPAATVCSDREQIANVAATMLGTRMVWSPSANHHSTVNSKPLGNGPGININSTTDTISQSNRANDKHLNVETETVCDMEDSNEREIDETSVPVTHSLPLTLPSCAQVQNSREEYLGPTDESNWVIRGKLLVGAYPACVNDEANRTVLESVLEQSVGTFVCLQDEYEHHKITEEMWRHGNFLRPYIFDAVTYCQEHHSLFKDEVCKSIGSFDGQKKDLGTGQGGSHINYNNNNNNKNNDNVSDNNNNSRNTVNQHNNSQHQEETSRQNTIGNGYVRERNDSGESFSNSSQQSGSSSSSSQIEGPCMVMASKLRFLHVPIVDCSCTSDDTILALCYNLCWRLIRGEVVYVHCWGGHGRTGTVVAVMLGLLYGVSTREALERTQMYHDIRRVPLQVSSPQTALQRQQVKRILDTLHAGNVNIRLITGLVVNLPKHALQTTQFELPVFPVGTESETLAGTISFIKQQEQQVEGEEEEEEEEGDDDDDDDDDMVIDTPDTQIISETQPQADGGRTEHRLFGTVISASHSYAGGGIVNGSIAHSGCAEQLGQLPPPIRHSSSSSSSSSSSGVRKTVVVIAPKSTNSRLWIKRRNAPLSTPLAPNEARSNGTKESRRPVMGHRRHRILNQKQNKPLQQHNCSDVEHVNDGGCVSELGDSIDINGLSDISRNGNNNGSFNRRNAPLASPHSQLLVDDVTSPFTSVSSFVSQVNQTHTAISPSSSASSTSSSFGGRALRGARKLVPSTSSRRSGQVNRTRSVIATPPVGSRPRARVQRTAQVSKKKGGAQTRMPTAPSTSTSKSTSTSTSSSILSATCEHAAASVYAMGSHVRRSLKAPSKPSRINSKHTATTGVFSTSAAPGPPGA